MPNTMTMPGAKAPSAPKPGMGTGNVPFAPGIMSGNLGQQTTTSPLARESGGHGMTLNINTAGPPAAKPPASGPAGPAAGMQQGPTIDPMAMMAVYDQFFRALMESVENDQMLVDGIY